jgi:Tfp pilus assembly protein PilV
MTFTFWIDQLGDCRTRAGSNTNIFICYYVIMCEWVCVCNWIVVKVTNNWQRNLSKDNRTQIRKIDRKPTIITFGYNQCLNLGKGQNYEFHNVENQKEHQKIMRWSLHWKASLKWSERQKRKRSEHQNANNHVKSSWSLLQKSQRRKEHRKS